MKQVVFVLCTLAISAYAHSWLACSDYKYGTAKDQDYYNPSQCFGWPRNWQSVAGGEFGSDRGYNFQGASSCRDPIGSAPGYGYSATYPMAQYKPGQQVCLAWPSKNHVADTCTNPYIPDTEFEIFINPTANPSADPAKFSTLVVNWTDHQNGVIDKKGFQACNKFCENMDKSLCSRCFTVPQGLTVGAVYTFQWYWIFNPGSPYTSCWEALITDTPGNSATATGVPVSTTGDTAPVSVTTAAAPSGGDAVVFLRKPTEIPSKAGSTFDIEIAYSTEGSRQITVDILDTTVPTPSWYGKGIAENVSGKGVMTVSMLLHKDLSAGQTYIFRLWIVDTARVSQPEPWAYELDRSDSYVKAGQSVEYGTSGGDGSEDGSDASVLKPVLFVLFVVAAMLF